MEPNMKANWNSGMNYGFPAVKTLMSMLGVWPSQRNELLCTIQWLAIVITEALMLVSFVAEYFQTCGDPKDSLEMALSMEGALHGWVSSIFPRLYMKRMAVNINSAVDDWSTLSTEKKPHVIMTSYARVGRVIVIGHLVVASLTLTAYMVSIVIEEKQQVLIVDNHTMITWNYLLPVTCLFGGVSYRTYYVLNAIQLLQLIILSLTECISDCFFFCITMHLCGQLELLRNRFAEIKKETNDKHHENPLRPLIKRHHQLIMLAKNIEDSFNINILMRFMLISVVIAMSGLRVITLIRHREYNEVLKMVLFIQFYILQCLLFTHAGDTLQTQSASITMAIYNTTWYELPPTTVKDLMFIMIRLKNPLRLSAGKFFYLTRTTMTDILKTTMTYISFIQVTMED